jgi:hypothetical protein
MGDNSDKSDDMRSKAVIIIIIMIIIMGFTLHCK